MEIRGAIEFTESGFILKPKGGDIEVWQKSNVVGDQYAVLNGFKYKWVNQPNKREELPTQEAPEDFFDDEE